MSIYLLLRRGLKVSTFDGGSQAWTSYYSDLLLVKSKPAQLLVIWSMLLQLVKQGQKLSDDD